MTAQVMLNLNDLRVEFLQSLAKDLALPAFPPSGFAFSCHSPLVTCQIYSQ
jgi:hypothetical protein